jgi:MFS transporter, DHA2 family, multidrug resistance protein
MAASSGEKQVTTREWIALFGAMLGAFMAVLDIQITNSSLNDIAGAIGSSIDEGSWISTAYLCAEIVAIGISGIMASTFSIRRYLLVSAIGFLIFSLLCAFCSNLSELIACRALQGLFGGALIPLAFNIILVVLPPSKQTIGLAIFGMTATFGPAIGPSIGGWLTDNWGWQWIFFINLPPGLALIAIIYAYLDQDPMHLERLPGMDYFGIFSMAIGLGSLEYVLEEGERKDWFGNVIIYRFAWIAGIFITLFLIRELTAKKPFLNLKLFKYRTFALSCVIQTALGVGLYGTVFIVPEYLSMVQKYSAGQIGSTLVWVGIPQLFILPFVPKLIKIFDIRLIIAVGAIFFAGSCFMNAFLDPDYARPQFVLSNIIRSLGQPLFLIPLLSMATSDIPKKEAGSASALFNMMRNMGGSFGIALLSTLVTNREHLHSVRIGSTVTAESPMVTARLNDVTSILLAKGLDPVTAARTALKILNNSVQEQSYLMAYSDAFYVIGAVLGGSILLLLFIPKPKSVQHAEVG